MRESTIAKHRALREPVNLAGRLGAEIRRRRVDSGLTQAELGTPLSRSFISSVEHGRVVPSLATLTLVAHRLGIGIGTLLDGVDDHLSAVYSATHADDPTPRGGG
ncbi:MAG: helix-turn-helix domain-containing protein [Candidatus Limnocylindrales bacterium]